MWVSLQNTVLLSLICFAAESSYTLPSGTRTAIISNGGQPSFVFTPPEWGMRIMGRFGSSVERIRFKDNHSINFRFADVQRGKADVRPKWERCDRNGRVVIPPQPSEFIGFYGALRKGEIEYKHPHSPHWIRFPETSHFRIQGNRMWITARWVLVLGGIIEIVIPEPNPRIEPGFYMLEKDGFNPIQRIGDEWMSAEPGGSGVPQGHIAGAAAAGHVKIISLHAPFVAKRGEKSVIEMEVTPGYLNDAIKGRKEFMDYKLPPQPQVAPYHHVLDKATKGGKVKPGFIKEAHEFTQALYGEKEVVIQPGAGDMKAIPKDQYKYPIEGRKYSLSIHSQIEGQQKSSVHDQIEGDKETGKGDKEETVFYPSYNEPHLLFMALLLCLFIFSYILCCCISGIFNGWIMYKIYNTLTARQQSITFKPEPDISDQDHV